MTTQRKIELKNLHVDHQDHIEFYHLGLSTTEHDVVLMFSDVKVVCMGGSSNRMRNLAHDLAHDLGIEVPAAGGLPNICAGTDRYVMYKVGPVLSVNHGIGMPSMSIVLHEVVKLLQRAGCVDPVFIRVGTCGGLGLEPGTVCLSQGCCDTQFRDFHEQFILGQSVRRPAIFDAKLTDHLEQAAEEVMKDSGCDLNFVTRGVTMSTNDFYEEQTRLDGAVCEFSEEERQEFLLKAFNDKGVRNLEMEALELASFAHKLDLRAACMAVVIVNRFQGDSVTASASLIHAWERDMTRIVAEFVRRQGLLPAAVSNGI